MTDSAVATNSAHAWLCGFVGKTTADEAPRRLLPVVRLRSGKIAACPSQVTQCQSDSLADEEPMQSMTRIDPCLPFRDGDVLISMPDVTGTAWTQCGTAVETKANGEHSRLRLLCAPQAVAEQFLKELAEANVQEALTAIEHGDVARAADLCGIALRSDQSKPGGRALLWVTETLRRPDDDVEPPFERHLGETLRQWHPEVKSTVDAARGLFRSRGNSLFVQLKTHASVRIYDEKTNERLAGPAARFGPLHLKPGQRVRIEPAGQAKWNRVNFVCHELWQALQARLTQPLSHERAFRGVAVVARNFCALRPLSLAASSPPTADGLMKVER